MKIDFVRLEKNNVAHYRAKHKWLSDEEINYLFTPQFVPTKIEVPTLKELMEYFDERDSLYNFMIYMGDEIVGDFQIDYQFKMLYSKEPSAWIGITIGDEQARGKGVGRQVMAFIEEHVKSKGFNRIELGVFAFNKKAIKFYENIGYKRIAEIKGFTFYNGKYHSDYRYEKRLGNENNSI